MIDTTEPMSLLMLDRLPLIPSEVEGRHRHVVPCRRGHIARPWCWCQPRVEITPDALGRDTWLWMHPMEQA